jgi:hypothetical protein
MSPYAVLVTDRQLMPITSGNRLRILGLIRALRELGWKVALAALPGAAPLAQLRPLVDDLLLVPAQPFCGGHLDCFDARPFGTMVRRLAARVHPALAIAEYTWLAPALDDCRGSSAADSIVMIFYTSGQIALARWTSIGGPYADGRKRPAASTLSILSWQGSNEKLQFSPLACQVSAAPAYSRLSICPLPSGPVPEMVLLC